MVLLLRPDVQVLTFSGQLEREAKFPTFSFQDVQLEQESFFALSRLAREKYHVMESKLGNLARAPRHFFKTRFSFPGVEVGGRVEEEEEYFFTH